MMKKIALTISLLFLGMAAHTQSCAEMLAAAEKAERAGQFRSAIQKYNAAARRCGPSRAAEIDAKVLGVFDKIEALKKRAEKAEKDAQIEAERARTAEKDAQDKAQELSEALVEIKQQKAATDSVLTIVRAEQAKNKQDHQFSVFLSRPIWTGQH
jgi:DNA repair exonuclease SbcCD ATPase subunit